MLDEYKGSQPVSELTALVALIRRVCGIDATISPYAETVRRNFQNWIMTHHSGSGEKFNEEQMDWLRMIRDHIVSPRFIWTATIWTWRRSTARAAWGRCIISSESGWIV